VGAARWFIDELERNGRSISLSLQADGPVPSLKLMRGRFDYAVELSIFEMSRITPLFSLSSLLETFGNSTTTERDSAL
jgi:hypothetical protein